MGEESMKSMDSAGNTVSKPPERRLSGLAWHAAVASYCAMVQLRSAASARPESTMRAADFYPRHALCNVMRLALHEFYYANGYLPNIFRPRTFNERIFYRKFLEDFHLPLLADKLFLNRLIRDRVGARFATDIVGATEDPEALTTICRDLPGGTFFLKANNGSGTNYKFTVPPSGLPDPEIREIVARGKSFLDRRYGYDRGEWFYHTFRPALFVEKALSIDDPVDWRLYVINGVPKLIQVTRNFYTHNHPIVNTYTPDWRELQVEMRTPKGPPVPKPELLPDIVALALTVAGYAKMGFIRIDLYSIDGQLIVSEVTYTPGDGLSPAYNQALFTDLWRRG
jgi:hypothetical protein